MQNKKAIYLSIFFLLPIFFTSLFPLVICRESDQQKYQEMVEQKREKKTHLPIASTRSIHIRKNVGKDIWIAQKEGARLHCQISSDNSLLTFTSNGKRFEWVETLSPIQCWMQEKFLYSEDGKKVKQEVRLIEADAGTYHHASGEFVAEGVSWSIFQLPGDTLPPSPTYKEEASMHGTTKNLSLIFTGKTPEFQAQHFQAKVVKK